MAEEKHSASVEDEATPRLARELFQATGISFDTFATKFRREQALALSAVNGSEAFARLAELHSDLSSRFFLGKIREIEAWADGDSNFHFVGKSWSSALDKIYRINVVENNRSPDGEMPRWVSVQDWALKPKEEQQWIEEWVTPDNYVRVVDDLIRTKIVVPFIDSVVKVSNQVVGIFDDIGVPSYKRYHAKDSGYHARHIYGLIDLPTQHESHRQVAIEVKVLTKLQDTLGEITHSLYEGQRVGNLTQPKKRSIAWEPERSEFWATYTSHAAHFVEAEIVRLRDAIAENEGT